MAINIISLVISLAAGLSFVVLLLTAGRYEAFLEPLDSKEFMMPELYGVGFRVLEMLKVQFKTPQAAKTRESMVILHGEKYADYYVRVLYAQKISLTWLVAAMFCALAALAAPEDRMLLLALGAVIAGCVYYYLGDEPQKKVKARSARFLNEFPNIVSTLALLVNSGMTLREAWREVSLSEESELYLEMRRVNEDIENGIAEPDALYAFGNRCVTPEIKKFTSFVVQGLEKGSRDLAIALRGQVNEMWEVKRQNTIRQGELASSKLMIPLMVMFAGVLILVMGPIISNLNL